MLDYSFLICPETKQELGLAPKEVLRLINDKIRRKALIDQDGKIVRKILNGALIRKDRQLLYPIREGLPIMLAGDAIDLFQIGVREVSRMMP